MTAIGSFGASVELLITQGATFLTSVDLKNNDGSAYDLTGCTIAGQVRKRVEDSSAVASFDVAIGSPRSGGTFTLGISKTVTSTFTFDAAVYDVLLTDATGAVYPILNGSIRVRKAVTRG